MLLCRAHIPSSLSSRYLVAADEDGQHRLDGPVSEQRHGTVDAFRILAGLGAPPLPH